MMRLADQLINLSMDDNKDQQLEKVVSLCKRRGFIFPGSELYGGLSGTWDYGPLGVELVRNIKNAWWSRFVTGRDDMYGLDAAILMNPKTWEASGHTGLGFTDPVVEDVKTGQRHRADHLLEANGVADAESLSIEEMTAVIKERGIKSPAGNELSAVRKFNLMFETKVGSLADTAATTYLRPETAQGMFVNFKNVLDSQRPKLPFGLAQIGKAFRNEITPRDFIFRIRELEQMEIEYFVEPEAWEAGFSLWLDEMRSWIADLGINSDLVEEKEIPAADRAHYSDRTVDFEFRFPFGTKELYGLAYRTDHDLKAHQAASGVSLEYTDPDGKRFTPHVIEPSFGVERTVLAVLLSAYREDTMNGEKRCFLKLPNNLAPYLVAVSPLLKNKPDLVSRAKEVFSQLKKDGIKATFDDHGNIGKRYRRQDEIGTPYCVVIDFDTLGESGSEHKDTVTLRDRDSGGQIRVKISQLAEKIKTG